MLACFKLKSLSLSDSLRPWISAWGGMKGLRFMRSTSPSAWDKDLGNLKERLGEGV